jgi:hypothetical protein
MQACLCKSAQSHHGNSVSNAGTNRKLGSESCLLVKETEERAFLPNWGTSIGQNARIGGCFDTLCCGDVDQRQSVLMLYQHQRLSDSTNTIGIETEPLKALAWECF